MPGYLMFAHSPWQPNFHEGFWRCEGL